MNRFADLHFPGAPRIVVEPPGPKALALLGLQEKTESAAVLYPRTLPLALDEGRGSTTRLELIRALVETAPGGLRDQARVLFGSPSGADSVESALKLARHHRNRYAVIAFEGSYHGQTAGALAVGSQTKAKSGLPPLAPETHFAPYPYCYRCPFGKAAEGGDGCCMEPARHLERILTDPYSGIPEPAAVILEPVQGEGGVIEAPDEFLREVRRITEERNIPLIERERQGLRIQDRGTLDFLLQSQERQGLRTRGFDEDFWRAREVEVCEAVHGSPAEVEMGAAAFARTGHRTGSSIAFSGLAFATRPTIVR